MYKSMYSSTVSYLLHAVRAMYNYIALLLIVCMFLKALLYNCHSALLLQRICFMYNFDV
jgi:hypothetical protein